MLVYISWCNHYIYHQVSVLNSDLHTFSDKGEVVRWSRVDQTQRYTVQHSTISDTVVDTTLHHDGSSLLLLDASHNVWISDNSGLSQLNPSSALGGRFCVVFRKQRTR